MPLVQSRVVSLSSPNLIKMEERKRPATDGHDGSAPPYKKQVTSVNGASKPHVDLDMPWKDDLEVNTSVLSNSKYPPNLASFFLGSAVNSR